jgi:hypothetical protein
MPVEGVVPMALAEGVVPKPHATIALLSSA